MYQNIFMNGLTLYLATSRRELKQLQLTMVSIHFIEIAKQNKKKKVNEQPSVMLDLL